MSRIFFLNILLTLSILFSACENMIQGPEDEKEPDNPTTGSTTTFSQIQTKLFSPSCALSGCHSGTVSPDLSSGTSYGQLVNVTSDGRPGMMRVKPGDSQNSYLIKKLTGDGTDRMPLAPRPAISPALIDSVRAWIDRGAKND